MKIASWHPDLTFIDGDVWMECSDINPESTVVLSLGCDVLFEVKKRKCRLIFSESMMAPPGEETLWLVFQCHNIT